MSSSPDKVSPSSATASSASPVDLAAYLSRLELELIERDVSTITPNEERFDGAIAFVDVSGFTPITEALAKHGPRGAESLSEILNDYYGRLTDIAFGYGGDVLFFAGDAAVVLFRGALPGAVHRAVSCGLEIRRRLDGFSTIAVPELRLSLRATVSAGALSVLRVGRGARLTLVTGEPISQVARLSSRRAHEGVIVSGTAHAALDGSASSRRVASDAFEVTRVSAPPAAPPAPDPPKPDVARLERALPEVVVQRVRAGQGAFLAEFRTLSVAFVGLGAGAQRRLSDLDEAVTALTALVGRFDGAVYQFLEDDKGTVFVVAFGIPPRVHEDDAARAALFAASAFGELSRRGMKVSIGVATGRLFCGAYGGSRRRQYSLVGPTINRAARLMTAASAHGVLCDEPTRRAAERHARFEALGTVALKGVEEPTAVSRPVSKMPPSQGRRSSIPATVGRDGEREALVHAVRATRDGKGQPPVVIVAEAGMGKSHMVGRLAEIARESELRFVKGEADSLETGTPFFAFRGVFADLLGIAGLSVEETRARVEDALSDARDLVPLAPLLSVVLPLSLPETPLTQQMTPQIRAENLTRVALHVVERAAEQAPFLLVVEDGHWLDSASWAFVGMLRRLVSRVTLVVTMRPMDHEPPDCAKLRQGAMELTLPPMTREQTVQILAQRFAVTAIPPSLADFVVARAEGNPFYTEEIAYSLRDSGLVRVAAGRLEATSGWSSLDHASFPESVEAVITTRVARLAASDQLVLKVASVVGRHFEEAAVIDALPVAADRADVPAALARLAELDLIAPEGDASYGFRHAVTRETTYGLLSYSQRRSLHRAVAEHLERRHRADLSPVYARLAHHWGLAEDAPKAMVAYGKAGEQSLGAYANEEAIAFLTRALELDEKAGAGAPRLSRARWLKLVGDAHYSLARHDRAQSAYEAGLRAAGLEPPSGALGALLELSRNFARRARRRLTGRAVSDAGDEARERARFAIDVNSELGAVFLWKGEQTKFLESAFMNSNMGDVLGPSGAAAAALSGAGYVLAIMGLRKLAESDLERAVALADAHEELLPNIQARLMQGMFLSLMGRPEQALGPLERADVLAAQLGGGLWKHRAKFMLGEPLLSLGRYEEAARVFGEAAVHSLGAEPTVVGFSYAMQALCRLRLGDVEQALALLEGPNGVQMIRSTTVPLQLFASLGPMAEARLEQGDVPGALAAVREAERAAPGEQANGYFAGIHGHAASCHVYLSIAGRAAKGAPVPLTHAEALANARRAVKRFAKFARTYPGARASSLLATGRLRAESGKVRSGLHALDAAAALAGKRGLPWEEATAHAYAARFTDGTARTEHVRRATELFERCSMKRELMRLRTDLG